MALDVTTLRELLRHLQEWESLFESDGIDELTHDGDTWCLWDIQRLYVASQAMLPHRQKQAIRLFLYENMKEKDAAVFMGVSETNPIAMYATTGLRRLLALASEGRIPGFRLDLPEKP
jgi:hypothetical protein